MYSDTVLDHFDSPRNAGPAAQLSGPVFSGAAGRVQTGARVEVDLAMDGRTIAGLRFRAYGCPHLIAAASWLTERVTGRDIGAVRELKPRDIARTLELPPEKLGQLLVLEDALKAAAQAAIAAYKGD